MLQERSERCSHEEEVVTATEAKRLEDGCKTHWGARRLWCEKSWNPTSATAAASGSAPERGVGDKK